MKKEKQTTKGKCLELMNRARIRVINALLLGDEKIVGEAFVSPLPKQLRARVRIKKGAVLTQNKFVFNWPGCKPPYIEYVHTAQPYEHRATNPDMEFEGRWNGKIWYCKADGYGHSRRIGDSGEYGNGALWVPNFYDVEIIQVQEKKAKSKYER